MKNPHKNAGYGVLPLVREYIPPFVADSFTCCWDGECFDFLKTHNLNLSCRKYQPGPGRVVLKSDKSRFSKNSGPEPSVAERKRNIFIAKRQDFRVVVFHSITVLVAISFISALVFRLVRIDNLPSGKGISDDPKKFVFKRSVVYVYRVAEIYRMLWKGYHCLFLLFWVERVFLKLTLSQGTRLFKSNKM